MASLVPAAHFGILVSFTMLTALLADLLLTPALIYTLRPWRRPGPGNRPEPAEVPLDEVR
jgi:predicted RND superfamily exporter protein